MTTGSQNCEQQEVSNLKLNNGTMVSVKKY